MYTDTICKVCLILFTFLFTVNSYGQSNKFSLIIEYSPHFSKLTNEIIDENYKLSHLGFIKIEYETKYNVNPTLGFGFMNTGEKIISDLDGQLGIEEVKFNHNYNYLMIPVGFKINIKDLLFVHPEFGIGYNLSHRVKQTTKFTNGDKETERNDIGIIFGEFNSLALPAFLTVGTNIELGKISLLIGVKAYYNFKQVVENVPRENHSYGFGLSLGLKI